MTLVHLLGTGAAVSDPHRTTTMLAVENSNSVIMVDCGGDALQRLMAANVAVTKITALILTHEHPDHVSGFPLFMEKIWLLGRRTPLPVYGIAPALSQAKRIFEAFDTSDWTDMPEIHWHEVALEENALVLDDDNWHISASPGTHSVPVTGLRFLDKQTRRVLTYSCDTAYSPVIQRLSSHANLLIHEATGEGYGHSSALQAAMVARDADVERLLLVHLPPESLLTPDMMQEARQVFAACHKGEEGATYEF